MPNKPGKPSPRISPFEAIRHVEEDTGIEYWSARELARELGYTEYGKFRNTIAKAEEACEQSGYAVADHFAHVSDMITVGKGARRRVEDVHLSRYACYLVVQNADPEKPQVALGQTYFAVQTRRQEISDADEERRLRIEERAKTLEHNRELAAQARLAGHLTPHDFAIFQDHGYRGLYNGETARDIHARKGLKRGQQILDWMGSTELAANSFRAALAREMLARDTVSEKEAANETHHRAGKLVRQTMAEASVPMPEDLPTPEKSYQQIKHQAERQAQIEAEDRAGLWGSLSLQELERPEGGE
ncbi:MAG TPA: DNA damage-inducible protein D [Ktedonobacterales bacterium]|nr:DNA damage-inducible protein D [Ktedonobacterales bacterium]